jgi:hypothetical protein
VLKQKLDIEQQKSEIKDQLIDLEKKRGDIYKEAFEKEKDLTDRALKLSESNKIKPWEILGALGIIAIIVTVIASAL